MTENLYAPPTSNLVQKSGNFPQLASRWKRLGAAIIDGVIGIIAAFPLIYYFGGFQAMTGKYGFMSSTGYLIGLWGVVVFILINGKFLYENGQTVGKKLLGIKIVNVDFERATIKRHILPRYTFTTLIAYIPIVSSIVPLVDCLFIFTAKRRCLHDYIGKTNVIDVD